MKTKSAPKSLSVVIGKSSGQSLEYREILQIEAAGDVHKLKIEIRSDSYKDQCSARVARWDGQKWQEVDHIVSGSMLTARGLAYEPNVRTVSFIADRDRLIEAAALVLA